MTSPQMPARRNPYVGPRSFRRDSEEAKLFFGREEEARQLLVRVQTERLTLFYAESGAGKSSLLNTRLIPGLEERGYMVLPVGRVSGAPPAGMMGEIDNIFAFNLMDQIDDDAAAPQRYAKATLSDFLKRLVSNDGVHFRFDPDLKPPPANPEEAVPYVLIIDQFEELLTTHPGRWLDRENFFRQLDQAMRDDPNLWVVLSLREDFVARIQPYAPLLADRMRGRFHMERMQEQQALDAVRLPAQEFGRPFAPEAAQALVDNLRQVRVTGEETAPGQYVEPVQLQVVCLQLWESLNPSAGHNITLDDLERLAGGRSLADFVDQALKDFYTSSLTDVLADPAVKARPEVTEASLRRFFSQQLITELGTRGFVLQGESQTGGLPNLVLRLLRDRYLLRAENRAGGVWYELIHDRFVEPIQNNNKEWFSSNLSPLQRQAALWDQQQRSPGLLLRGDALSTAKGWAKGKNLELHELEFLEACQKEEEDVQRENRQNRRIRVLGLVSVAVAILAFGTSIWAWRSSQLTRAAEQRAIAALSIAEENAALARVQLDRQAGLSLIQQAYELKEEGNATGAIEKFRLAAQSNTELGIDIDAEIEDVHRHVATALIRAGEILAKGGDFPAAEEKFKAALTLTPPLDVPVYVFVPSGSFQMGYDKAATQERPVHSIALDAYWIGRTEVTNAQYLLCVGAKENGADDGCDPPLDGNIRYRVPQFERQPVTGVSWFQAHTYARWVGGSLPSEAQWEKACRGDSGRLYPWGDTPPSKELLNYRETGLETWSAVGSYPESASPYGALDMVGNVWEWVNTAWGEDLKAPSLTYPYNKTDGREDSQAPASVLRINRGGSYFDSATDMRCTVRNGLTPPAAFPNLGFRVVFDEN